MSQPLTKTMRDELEAHGLEAHELHLLARALCCSELDEEFEKQLYALAIVGLTELADWIIGRKRFNTLSEIDISRVLRVFLEIRSDIPSVESLAEDFGISEARGRSMLSRMNYGEARHVKARSYRFTAQSLSDELSHTKVEKGRKALTVDIQRLAYIQDAVWEILSSSQSDCSDTERPEMTHRDRHGATVLATPKTWEYIMKWMEKKAKEIEGNS